MKLLQKLVLALTLLLPVGLTSCEVTRDLNLATTDCLVRPEDIASEDVYVLQDSEVPKEIREAEAFKDKKFILAPKEMLKPDCMTSVPLDPTSEGFISGTFGAVLTGFGIMFPKLAALEGFLLFLSRRKRQHYAAAVTSLAKADVKSSVVNVGRALGMAHSSPDTKAVFEAPKTAPLNESK